MKSDCSRKKILVKCNWTIMKFFLFKQKTAYEMRISDWSSDVCSSDLFTDRLRGDDADSFTDVHRRAAREVTAIAFAAHAQRRFADQRRTDLDRLDFGVLDPLRRRRSEEHTSELQSLMRISYAVFCLKKKTKQRDNKHKKTRREYI